jgi:hypothetical protein
MALYRVIIHGRNFRLKLEGEWEKFGFYTTWSAEAPDPVLAEQVALEDFRQTQKYVDLVESSLNSAEDPPVISGEEITVISSLEGKSAAGLAFYRESRD